MRIRRLVGPLALVLVLASQAASAGTISWRSWSADLFQRAKAENRFVLLDLEAVWCHWCHVMDETTYADPRVVSLLEQKFIPVRVDQDANPDLATRYGDWGWPATIVFAADGSEIVKRRGYLPPESMASLLAAIIEDPSPGPSVGETASFEPASSPFLSTGEKQEMAERFDAAFDEKDAGWGSLHKFIDTDFMDFALSQAERGDAARTAMARRTLDAALKLIDPVWGGVYQYSDSRDWGSPHYEKIMWHQAQALRQYSQAAALWKDSRHRDAAAAIAHYLTTVLWSREGAFMTSQDADVDASLPGKAFYALDAEARAKLGRAPRVDATIYARENGWAISGLAAYFSLTGDRTALDKAVQAAEWVTARRGLSGGGFRHGENDRGGPFLGDTLAMTRAALDLYAATGDRRWLSAAATHGAFIEKTFRDEAGGYVASASAEAGDGVFSRPVTAMEDQTQAARLFNRLHRYTGDPAFRAAGEHAMRAAVGMAVVSRQPSPGVLLASDELSREPTHITVVGHRDDAAAEALHAAARRFPALDKRIDWWDKREGPLMNPDVTYPELDRAAAFVCSNRICSLPVFETAELPSTIRRILGHTELAR